MAKHCLWLLLFFCFTGRAQTSLADKPVTLKLQDATFDQLIAALRHEQHINIVYLVDRVQPERKTISLDVQQATLREVMVMVCAHYGLTFEFLKDYVVLKPGVKKAPRQVVASVKPDTVRGVVQKDIEASGPAHNYIQDVPVIASLIKDDWKDSVVYVSFDRVQKKIPATSGNNVVTRPRLRSPVKHFVSLAALADLHSYQFAELADPNQNYTAPVTYGYAMQYGIQFGKKLRVEVGASYTAKEFVYNRNFRIMVPDDPVPIPNSTRFAASYIEVPVSVSYPVLTQRGYTIRVTGGMNAAFLTSKLEVTEYLTQGEPNTHYFKDDADSFLMGSRVGVRASTKIGERLSLFCEPVYVKYFSPLNTAIMKSGADLLRINAGLALSFERKR